MMLKHRTAGLLLALGPLIAGCSATGADVTVQWQPPAVNEDGSRLTDLEGYRVYWGPPERPFANHVVIDSPKTTSYVLEDLPDGEWHVAVSAFTERDLESKMITGSVLIKDGELTVDEDTLGKIVTKPDEGSADSQKKRMAKQ